MSPEPPDRATRPVVSAAESGQSRNTGSVDVAFGRVYASLKGLAHQVRGGRAGETLNTTALVHEAFVKLSASAGATWKDEAHFFALAARAMRQIVLDAARRDVAAKRGGDSPMMSYDDAQHAAPIRSDELLALDAALERLTSVDPRRAQVGEITRYAGVSSEQSARLRSLTPRTKESDWRAARAWLAIEIDRAGRDVNPAHG